MKLRCPSCLGRKEVDSIGMMGKRKCNHCDGTGQIMTLAEQLDKFDAPRYEVIESMVVDVSKDLIEDLESLTGFSTPKILENKKLVDDIKQIEKKPEPKPKKGLFGKKDGKAK